MTRTFAIAALLAATAFTPALAQDAAREDGRFVERPTAAEPTPVRAEVQLAQSERGERGPRAEGRGDGGGQARPEGGWQRRQQAPVPQAQAQAPAPVQVQQAAPAQQRWNRGEAAGGAPNWQARNRPDGAVRVQNGQDGQRGWSRGNPQVTATPAPVQTQRNWQGGEGRRDTWRNNNGNGGVVVQQQQDNRRWNGNNTANRNDGRWNNDRRNDGRWSDNRGNDGRRNDGQWNGNGRNDTWRNDGRYNNGRYDQRNNWQNQYRDWNRNWSRDWRRDQRYDWQRYRYSNRNLFRGQAYYAPYGWDYGYRRFSIGFTLSSILFDQQYWIDDPYAYRLPPVYGPYRWVRYYDDVLLVDLRSGQVVDTIYDFFE
jgi:hypothetical protein